MPSEQEILRRDVYRNPKYGIPDEVLIGVNTSALAYAASHALSISETPTVAFENMGGFNATLRIEFPQDGTPWNIAENLSHIKARGVLVSRYPSYFRRISAYFRQIGCTPRNARLITMSHLRHTLPYTTQDFLTSISCHLLVS